MQGFPGGPPGPEFWHADAMSKFKPQRRLLDTYAFPGFRPQAAVKGVFGDPKARIVTLHRRAKKRAAGAAVARIGRGTTGRSGAFAIYPAAIPGSISSSRSDGSSARRAAR
jgi:hypothetical protein